MQNNNYPFGAKKEEPLPAATRARNNAHRITAVGVFPYATDAHCMSFALSTLAKFWPMAYLARMFWLCRMLNESKTCEVHCFLTAAYRSWKLLFWKRTDANLCFVSFRFEVAQKFNVSKSCFSLPVFVGYSSFRFPLEAELSILKLYS